MVTLKLDPDDFVVKVTKTVVIQHKIDNHTCIRDVPNSRTRPEVYKVGLFNRVSQI